MRTNVIVVGYGLKDLEQKCLDAVIRHTHYPYLLTYYDNKNSGLTLTQAWNRLIHSSPSKYICLLNNDTEVTDGWLSKLVDTFNQVPQCGFAGPSTNNCHSPQKELNTPARAAKHFNKMVKMSSPISGFCLVFTKETFIKLGGFDERYTLYGQESDFIDRARTKFGLYSYWRQDSFVYHIGEASVKSSKLDVKAERDKAKQTYWADRG